jgi:hypothetical protein
MTITSSGGTVPELTMIYFMRLGGQNPVAPLGGS